MRKNFNLLFLFCTFFFSSCDYETTKQPAKEAYSFLTKQDITLEEIKAIVLQDQMGDFYLMEDKNQYASVIEGFIEHENSECREIKDELKKWGENFGGEPFEPFKYRDELLSGDIITSYQDRIMTIGFSYCKGSNINLNEFISKATKVERIDSLFDLTSDFLSTAKDSTNILRHNPSTTGLKDLSYYRKVE